MGMLFLFYIKVKFYVICIGGDNFIEWLFCIFVGVLGFYRVWVGGVYE